MTRKMILIASVAGIALTAPAFADKGGKGGNQQDQQAQQQQAKPQRGGGGGGGQQAQRQERPQQAQRVERQQMQRMERPQQVEQQQRAERPQVQRIERPQRVERQQQRVERQAQRVERPQRIERQQQRMERPLQVERQQQRMERPLQVERQQQRIERQAQRDVSRAVPQFDRQQGKVDRRVAEQTPVNRDNVNRDNQRFDGRALRPAAPVFATREMRPMTPFKAKFDNRQLVSIGQRVAPNYALAPVPSFYANNYVDTPQYYYRYDDRLGSIYQIERNDGIVRSLIPLFGGYNVGNPWPATYYSSYVPDGYRDYYYDTPDYYYRNDGYGIYQVDSSTQLISALVALVMGQSYGIGQTLPASYDVYNVPLDYRDRYADSDDSWYRYGDGYIYQVDPGSRQIAARYPIYEDNYYVGEPWPAAYPDYNVPYGYRSAYYDTPQYQYRYADGGIYQVNPTNQLITALVALVSGNQFSVGQRMPSGYDSYNVPFDYRNRYADSSDEYYRYANGYVYRVDPDSWLIEDAYPVYT